MMRSVRHISRLFLLLFYAVYAFTPVNMYAVTGYSGRSPDLLHPGKHASADIVWVNILFSSFLEDVEATSAGTRISSNVKQDSDVVLVKKRRAIMREQFDGKPLFDEKSMPIGGLERPSAHFTEYETAESPHLRETDGCRTLNSGLSPPSFIS